MPYPERLLNSYEKIIEDLHPHWIFLAGPVAGVVVGAALAVVAQLAPTSGTGRTVTVWAALAVLAVALLVLLVRFVRWRTTNFVITTDRLIFRTGVFGKSGIEIPLERVNNVSLDQSFIERVVGTGSLLIESGGEDGRQQFSHIADPERIQNAIHAGIEANTPGGHGSQARYTGPALDVASQLEKLEGLVQRGTITPEEFAAQKAKLLGT
jgi:uncharacterized membrane protein YdbT with pleckstrin-like domain